MSVVSFKEYMDGLRVKYDCIHHPLAYTASEVAHLSHISGKELAKVLVLKADNQYVMLVLPACCKVDTLDMAKELHVDKVGLANEYEFKDRFPGCEVGAMPPFGNLFSMKVYIDDRFVEGKNIAFNAGNHTDLFSLSYEDFLRVVHPTMVHMTH